MGCVVWKFPLMIDFTPGGCQALELETPGQPIILSVGLQNGQPCLWAIVNPELDKRTRTLMAIGTGFPGWRADLAHRHYLGTIVDDDRGWVAHLFDEEVPF